MTIPEDHKGTPYFRFRCPRTECGITDSEPGRCPKHGAPLYDSWQEGGASAPDDEAVTGHR